MGQIDKFETIDSYLRKGATLRLETIYLRDKIAKAADMIVGSFNQGNKLLTFGNGGSAADAQHIAAEFTGRFRKNRRSLPAIALTVNPSTITAISNDLAFDRTFSRQVLGLAKPGDVVLGISTSGTSKNVLMGLAAAREVQANTIGLCGKTGSMGEYSDILLAVPDETTSLLQEIHITIGHILCLLVEDTMFG